MIHLQHDTENIEAFQSIVLPGNTISILTPYMPVNMIN